MDRGELHNSFLLKQFYEFYNEVIRLKGDIAIYQERLESEHKDSDPGDDSIHRRLLNLLENQVLEARRRGGEYGVTYYKDAQFVMAALADEIFLHIDWKGKEAWKSNLLEFRLFGTYVAGELFFTNLKKILKHRDPADIDIGVIYLFALSIGFKGKFRGMDDKGGIRMYKKELFNFIFQKDPDLFKNKKSLFPQTYAHTLRQKTSKRLPDIRWWVGLIIIMVVTGLFIAHSIWVYLIIEILEIAETIISYSNSSL